MTVERAAEEGSEHSEAVRRPAAESLNGAGALDSRHDSCGDSGAINVTVIVDVKCTLAAVTGGGTAGE